MRRPYPTLKPECIYEIPDMDSIVRERENSPMLISQRR